MKLLTYQNRLSPELGLRLGLLWPGGSVIDLVNAARALGLRSLPTDVVEYLEGGALTRDTVEEIIARADEFGTSVTDFVLPLGQANLRPPLPRPASLRCFFGSHAHSQALWAWSGRQITEEWNQHPHYNFANHRSVYGPEGTIPRPSVGHALDFGLSLACVIGRAGVNILAEEAPAYIAGYSLCNEWALRDLQSEEIRAGAGLGKSRDFAVSVGPYLVTPDELPDSQDRGTPALAMTARVNGEERSRSNSDTVQWPFPKMIEWASREAPIYPGDVLIAGPVTGGSLLEATGGTVWLQAGDLVALEADVLGSLRNTVE